MNADQQRAEELAMKLFCARILIKILVEDNRRLRKQVQRATPKNLFVTGPKK